MAERYNETPPLEIKITLKIMERVCTLVLFFVLIGFYREVPCSNERFYDAREKSIIHLVRTLNFAKI